MPGTFSVPARRWRSCGPPWKSGASSTPFADEERAGALRGVHLVAGDGEQVDVLEFAGEIERKLGGGLHGVGVDEDGRAVSFRVALAMRAILPTGWMAPVSLLASITLTSFVCGRSAASKSDGFDYAVGVWGKVRDLQ